MAAANLIVVSGYYLVGTSPTLADSASNTWTPLTEKAGATSGSRRMWYCFNPTTSAAHTFSLNGTATYASLSVMAFSGVQSSPVDQEGPGTNQEGAATTANTDAITTGQANTIVCYTLGDNAPPSGTATVNTTGAGAVIAEQSPLVGGTSFANVFVYHILSSVEAAYQPQFSFSSTTNSMTGIVSFKHDGTGAFVASTIKQGDLNGSGTSPAINTAGAAVFNQTVAASCSPAAAVVASPSVSRTVAASCSPVSAVQRAIGKPLSDSVTATASITVGNSFSRTVAATTSPVATVLRALSKAVSATCSPVATMDLLTGAIQVTLAASVSPIARMARAIGKLVAGAVSPVAASSRVFDSSTPDVIIPTARIDGEIDL